MDEAESSLRYFSEVLPALELRAVALAPDGIFVLVGLGESSGCSEGAGEFELRARAGGALLDLFFAMLGVGRFLSGITVLEQR